MATFSKRLILVKNMLAGLNAHASELSKRGITQEVLDQMSQLYEKATKQDDDRNALKARSQEATAEAEQTMYDLESRCSEAKKLVRMDLSEQTWPEFGFRKGEFASKAAPALTE
jgi:hypothetical protein